MNKESLIAENTTSDHYEVGIKCHNCNYEYLQKILKGRTVEAYFENQNVCPNCNCVLIFLHYKITKKEVFNVPRGEGSWKCNCGTWNDPYSDRCRECKEFLRTINEKNCGGSCYAMSVPSSFL